MKCCPMKSAGRPMISSVSPDSKAWEPEAGAQDFSNVFRDFGDIFGDFGIFDSFFGGGRGSRRRSSAVRGADLRYDLRVPFKDAAFGTKVEVSYNRSVQCETCGGKGAKQGTGKKTCPSCGGSGQVRRSSGFSPSPLHAPTAAAKGPLSRIPVAIAGDRVGWTSAPASK
jgi:molecular chaperone DnaJ